MHDDRRVTEFAQMLVGAQRDGSSCCPGTPFKVIDAHTFLSAQPGVGADFHVARHVAARMELDRRLVRRFGTIERAPRYLAGMVVK